MNNQIKMASSERPPETLLFHEMTVDVPWDEDDVVEFKPLTRLAEYRFETTGPDYHEYIFRGFEYDKYHFDKNQRLFASSHDGEKILFDFLCRHKHAYPKKITQIQAKGYRPDDTPDD